MGARSPNVFLLAGIVHAATGCGAEGHDVVRPEPEAVADSGSSAPAREGDGGGALPLPWPAATVPPVPEPADNPTTPEKAELGRLLFYDPVVSSDSEVACGTCHSEIWGMSDGLPRSIGIGAGIVAGPIRRGDSVVRRNAQTLWNVGYVQELFHDGRAASLEDQATFPLDAELEFNRDVDAVVADIASIGQYVALFEAAFPEDDPPVTILGFRRALAAFQRTLVSDRALYDAYVAGDEGALSDQMVDGMFVFAEVGCASCHAPPLFASNTYADRDVPPLDGVEDLGRFEVTGDPADRGRFRVPTLRNVRETGPYFHTGAVVDLADAVRHEVDVAVSRGESEPVSDSDVEALVEFVKKALVDVSREPDRPESVPSGLAVPLDHSRLLH